MAQNPLAFGKFPWKILFFEKIKLIAIKDQFPNFKNFRNIFFLFFSDLSEVNKRFFKQLENF
jgi:hypothetical protein